MRGVRKKKAGGARMKEQGYRLVQLWLDATEARYVERAAEASGKRIATYVRETVVGEAKVAHVRNTDPNG